MELARRGEKATDCKEVRLAVIVGPRGDPALDGADRWLLGRAKALGGPFRLWVDRSAADPLDSFRDQDITGGRQHPKSERYTFKPERPDLGLGDLLADCRKCRGRIVELVVFHHGSAVDEAVLAGRLRDVFNSLQVPVCRVVWWSCNAAVSLDVERDGATDFLMRILGSLARCAPCGCGGPVELIWPTEGRCYLTDEGAASVPQTNDGKVHRARWGYRQPDGSLGLDPPPGDPHPSPEPPDREPPYGEAPETGEGRVLGVPVEKRP
jgi:hypothetical protein